MDEARAEVLAARAAVAAIAARILALLAKERRLKTSA